MNYEHHLSLGLVIVHLPGWLSLELSEDTRAGQPPGAVYPSSHQYLDRKARPETMWAEEKEVPWAPDYNRDSGTDPWLQTAALEELGYFHRSS